MEGRRHCSVGAFASVSLAWIQTIGADSSKLNVNRGGIALGHPLGGSGTKLMTTLVYRSSSEALAMECKPCAKGAAWPM